MRSNTEEDYKARMLRVLVFIQDHLDETISLDDLAKVAHFSPYHFHRLFRGLIGESVMGFIRRPQILGIVHDDPEVTPADKVRYDACIVVNERVQPEADVGVQEVAGEFAVATHRGPYDTLGRTYARLCGHWLPASGRELKSAPAVEIYRNSPMNTPPDDLLTDIHLPLLPE